MTAPQISFCHVHPVNKHCDDDDDDDEITRKLRKIATSGKRRRIDRGKFYKNT